MCSCPGGADVPADLPNIVGAGAGVALLIIAVRVWLAQGDSWQDVVAATSADAAAARADAAMAHQEAAAAALDARLARNELAELRGVEQDCRRQLSELRLRLTQLESHHPDYDPLPEDDR